MSGPCSLGRLRSAWLDKGVPHRRPTSVPPSRGGWPDRLARTGVAVLGVVLTMTFLFFVNLVEACEVSPERLRSGSFRDGPSCPDVARVSTEGHDMDRTRPPHDETFPQN